MLGHAGRSWGADPAEAALVLFAVAYLWGRRRALDAAPQSALGRHHRLLWFWAAVVVVAISIGPPIDPLADDLFSVHMVQHLLLGLIAPLPLVLCAPIQVISFAFPAGFRRRVARLAHRIGRSVGMRRDSLRAGAAIAAIYVANLGLWHVPVLYDRAVGNELIHGIEHLTFVITGVLVMWGVVGAGRQTRSGVAIVELFGIALPMGALAAILTLAGRPFYSSHLQTAPQRGLTALEDQQLAGAVMWVPGGVIVLGLAIAVFLRWLSDGPRLGDETIDLGLGVVTEDGRRAVR